VQGQGRPPKAKGKSMLQFLKKIGWSYHLYPLSGWLALLFLAKKKGAEMRPFLNAVKYGFGAII
jgi:hypothetical protein